MQPKIKALLKQIESGQMKATAARILDFVQKRPGVIIVHIESLLNISNKTAHARLCDLEDLGVIYKGKHSANDTYSNYYYEPDVSKQENNAAFRELEKFKLWKVQGLGKFKHLINEDLFNALNTQE